MKRLILITTFSFVAILAVATPFTLLAQADINYSGPETTYDQSFVPCGYKDTVTEVQENGQWVIKEQKPDNIIDKGNECKFIHVIIMAKRIIMAWIIAGATFATLGFAYAGYLYITAMGSEEKITHAHAIFGKTVWGFVFMLSAFLIVYALQTAFLTDDAKTRSILQTPPPGSNQ